MICCCVDSETSSSCSLSTSSCNSAPYVWHLYTRLGTQSPSFSTAVIVRLSATPLPALEPSFTELHRSRPRGQNLARCSNLISPQQPRIPIALGHIRPSNFKLHRPPSPSRSLVPVTPASTPPVASSMTPCAPPRGLFEPILSFPHCIRPRDVSHGVFGECTSHRRALPERTNVDREAAHSTPSPGCPRECARGPSRP